MGGVQSLTQDEVAGPAIEGMLDKRSEHVRAWRERYFRLEPEAHHLNYWDFQSESNGAPKGYLDLTAGFVDVYTDGSAASSAVEHPFQFIIKEASGSQWVLCAKSAAERTEWIKKIHTATLPVKQGVIVATAIVFHSPEPLSLSYDHVRYQLPT
eukprot:SAG11_NODE_8_length_31217_cov_52.169677_14_plen_154_part_00